MPSEKQPEIALAAWWRDFSNAQGLETKHPVQRIETRKAFYAGMFAMFHMNMDIAKLDEDGAVTKFEALQLEFEQFFRDEMESPE